MSRLYPHPYLSLTLGLLLATGWVLAEPFVRAPDQRLGALAPARPRLRRTSPRPDRTRSCSRCKAAYLAFSPVPEV